MKHERLLEGRPFRFSLDTLSDELLDEFFFDSNQNFLVYPRLLTKFGDVNHLQKILETENHEAIIERLMIQDDQSRSVLQHSNIIGSANEMRRVLPSTPSYKSTALIWDTRASFGLTSFRCDLVDCVECDIPLKDITKIN